MNKPRLPIIVFLLAFLMTLVAHAEVWTATNQWSPAVEQQYQDWVRTRWSKTIFTEPGPLQGVTLDCADAVISMRLLFAYENRLPFAVKDPSSNRAITNDMGRFDKYGSTEQRVRAFANYLYDILDTPELPMNSYPVAINRSAMHAGIFLKTDKATHHSWTVKDIDRYGIPYLLYASRPARTVLIDRHDFPTMGFLWGFQDGHGLAIAPVLRTPGDVNSGVGFRMYRYPADILKPVWQVPGYSTDQYQMPRMQLADTIKRALQFSAEPPEESANRLLGEACKEATDRIGAVNDAIKAMSSKPSSYCFSAQEYDDYSTPSRDTRAIGAFKKLVDVYNANQASFSAATRAKVGAVVDNRDPGTYCPIRASGSTRLTLGEVVNAALAGRWSSNPNDSLLARWGKERSPTSHAASCPTY